MVLGPGAQKIFGYRAAHHGYLLTSCLGTNRVWSFFCICFDMGFEPARFNSENLNKSLVAIRSHKKVKQKKKHIFCIKQKWKYLFQ